MFGSLQESEVLSWIPNVDKPDFEALRAQRNAAVRKMLAAVAKEWGTDVTVASFDFNACYCACGDKGPCEHDFKGWRDIYDDQDNVCGGEAVCERCGMGAMSHSIKIGM